MKKTLIVLLSLCLMGMAVAAAPSEGETAEPEAAPVEEVIDLSGYDDDTLVALLRQVQSEMVARQIEKTAALPAGTYVFGEDLPVGNYFLKKDQEEQYGFVNLEVAGDEDDKDPRWLYKFIAKEPYEAYITGKEGDMLTIEFPCSLTISAGVVFQ